MRRHIYAGCLQVKAGDWVAPQLFLRKLIDTCVPGRSSGLPFVNGLPDSFISGLWLIPSRSQVLPLRGGVRWGGGLTATGIAPVLHRTSLLIPAMRRGNRLQVQMCGNLPQNEN
jgi:hypothetical protein